MSGGEYEPLERIRKLWAELNQDERMAHLNWTLQQCATCGHPGAVRGEWCETCLDKWMLDEWHRQHPDKV